MSENILSVLGIISTALCCILAPIAMIYVYKYSKTETELSKQYEVNEQLENEIGLLNDVIQIKDNALAACSCSMPNDISGLYNLSFDYVNRNYEIRCALQKAETEIKCQKRKISFLNRQNQLLHLDLSSLRLQINNIKH